MEAELVSAYLSDDELYLLTGSDDPEVQTSWLNTTGIAYSIYQANKHGRFVVNVLRSALFADEPAANSRAVQLVIEKAPHVSRTQ